MGRSMSAVPVTLHLWGYYLTGLGQAGQDRAYGVDGHVGTVQQDQRPASPVHLVVHPQPVDLGVVALGTVHPFPFLVARGATGLSIVAATVWLTLPSFVRLCRSSRSSIRYPAEHAQGQVRTD